MSLADPVISDADLVAGVLAGDQASFAQVYDRYADKLFDFAHSMLRNREDAADSVADAFITAAEKLSQLREPQLLRPWLYSVTRRECLRRIEARKRIAFDGDDRLVVMADEDLNPEERAEAESLRRLVWDAATGLNDRDRAVLDLHLRQGLDGAELAAALDVTPANAYTMMSRLRDQLERSLGALLIARMGREDCEVLEELLADWDGRFTPLVRKRVARHVDDCDVCSKRRAMIINPWAAFAAIPPLAAPTELRDRVLGSVTLVAQTSSSPTGTGWWRRHLAAVLAAVLVIAGVVGAAWFWPSDGEPGGSPEPTSTTSPTPSPTPTTATPAPGEPELSLDRTAVDVSRSSQAVVVTNTGERDLTFTATPSAGWITVTPASTTVEPGDSVRLAIARREVAEGRSTGQVDIASDGGSAVVSVVASRTSPPRVGSIQFQGTSCSVPVSVTITDESRIRSVRLTWSGNSSGSTSMQLGNGAWRRTVPITVGGAITFRVTATDVHGESATRSRTVTLDPCPG